MPDSREIRRGCLLMHISEQVEIKSLRKKWRNKNEMNRKLTELRKEVEENKKPS